MENEKVYRMNFSKIYPLLVNKAVKKGRAKEEVDEVIRWLTGYSQTELEEMSEKEITYGDFFRNAPHKGGSLRHKGRRHKRTADAGNTSFG